MAAYLTQRCWKSWETTQEWEPRFFQDLGERWGSVVGDSVSAYVKELDDRYVLPMYRRQPLEIVGAEGTEVVGLSLIHISEPTRRTPISYAVFCLKKKKKKKK